MSSFIYDMANAETTGSPQTSKLAKLMLKSTQGDRGTVAGLVAWVDEVDKANDEGMVSLSLNASGAYIRNEPRQKFSTLSSQGLYDILLHHFHTVRPDWHLHSHTGCTMDVDSLPLEDTVIFFDYVQLGKS
ncbi:hypothetical protein A0H81_09172 [Grifola frondosa]|uniref:Uncharacterized protein n=1 Tax=Grifola frondosa TaxID=5627 RepID=A0A1C7M100_GRIFR|nr:hypothetical protein A0H81_09172 [Grifola frondosa]